MLFGLALALGAASTLAGPAQAGISGSAFVAPLPDQLLPLEKAQFVLNGRNYCWYDAGWQGPGWYWCGYAYRTGLGWGGGYGWNGWRHAG